MNILLQIFHVYKKISKVYIFQHSKMIFDSGKTLKYYKEAYIVIQLGRHL
jgi:hypothetical protein